jgi:hypothetical protein
MTIHEGQGFIYKYTQLDGMLRAIQVGHLKLVPTVFTHGYRTSFG